ncbi:DNA-directed RNA polymerase III subunit RPC2 [Paramyrothecium foliicola]|nr:DNA-directed RNA polymerase III subunit RPC2 [Paramyrothecium foliicola]
MPWIDDGFEALLEPFYNGKKLTDPISTKEDKFQLLPAFLKVKGKHCFQKFSWHIDSYNFFVEHEIKEIVRANRTIRSDVNDNFWLEFTDIRVERPCRQDFNDAKSRNEVTPMECRLRDMTYAAPILVDIAYIRDKQKIVRKNVPLGRMPVMLRSSKCRLGGANNARMELMNECPLDPGGYFIINGTEKVILIQEQLSKNRVIVEADEKNNIISASVTSSTHERKSKTTITMKKEKIVLTQNALVEGIPIVIILKAFGGLTDYEIMQLVAGSDGRYQDQFSINFEEAARAGVFTQHQALEYVGTRVKMGSRKGQFGPQARRNTVEEGLDVLANIVIAHVPIEGLDFYPKAIYVAMMTRRVLIAAHDPKKVDDRDFVGNKRLELAGQLLSLLFEDLFKRFTSEVKMSIDKFLKKNNRAVPLDAVHMISNHANNIGIGINRAIQTGNWTVKRFNMNRAGVTHVLSRLSYIAALGMMTRISSQFEKTRKVSGPRALQPSQWGMLCPSDTPEGEACGLVKNLALMTHITTNVDEDPVKRWIFTLDASVEPIRNFSGAEMHREGNYIIHVNGTPFALTRYPRRFAQKFRTMRRRGWISPFVSINLNTHFNAVHVATDEGRICRPYIIVKNGQQKLKPEHLRLLQLGKVTFDDFLTHGIVEYLDVNEEQDALITLYEQQVTKSTTHLEIEPFTLLGAVAGLIPFPHHNQSPRNTYQCAMGKQAIGAIAYNQFNRIDTLLYTLVYPQRPMVISKTIQLVHYDKLPAGQNATVVVMSYSGYDIEDALVLNKASIDRGFGRCQVFRKYTTELQKYPNGRRERIGHPENEGEGAAKQRIAKHEALDDDGLAIVGYRINSGEAMVKKETPLDLTTTGIGLDRGPSEYRDSSVSYRIPDPAYIDKVMISHTEKDTTIVKVQTRQTRRPELGDKFSSRHGQKGVVGIIVEQEDMPFADTGLTPDIIMNPHGFPSRMTVGKLLECLTGKASILDGRPDYGFGDAFRSHPVEDMGKALLSHGFSWEGKDYFTSGLTGEPLEAYIFNGPIYYQRLKHMVQDKMHSRSRGPRAILTRQPTEGRSRDGGLRLGEMERDCLIAYGASQLLLERLMISSDGVQLDICQQCGLFGYKGYCNTCKSTREVTKMTMPYAAKLLVQELISMNVGVRLQLQDEFPHPR